MKPSDFSKQQIQAALSLPGFDRWRSNLDSPQLHRPPSRPRELAGVGREAAVMALLYPAKELSQDAAALTQLVLIRRSRHLRHHAGQMVFPGGRQEKGESLQATALRETHEEIDVSLQSQDVLGELRSVYLPPSDFTLTPFVGWLDERPTFRPDASEVEEVISLPLRAFLVPATQTTAAVVRDNGQTIDAPCYQYDARTVWGATALVISELVARLRAVAATENDILTQG